MEWEHLGSAEEGEAVRHQGCQKAWRAGSLSEDRGGMGRGLARLAAQDLVTGSSCHKAQMCQTQAHIAQPASLDWEKPSGLQGHSR